ncbi:MAG: hypothetical protein Q7R66_21580 [Undibacterium sp.]|uniref:hypothetical protein n=1 Tax=Undibacterium sp. TaxID=1914977 RepID=UPI00271EED1E|nr:hypothetical protein [Undibacterium sp.]MDO8654769.1 hypothetical protein [Undibacterium sp.]
MENYSIMRELRSNTPPLDINQRIADRVSNLRAERGISLDALAIKCNVIQYGASYYQLPEKAAKDCRLFGCTITK